VIINANDHVLFSGSSAAFSSVGDVYQVTVPQGNGGNVQISTNSLEVLNGAQLIANTFGLGNAGNVIINASDHVTLDGTSVDGQCSSAIFVSSLSFSPAGDIVITTPCLRLDHFECGRLAKDS
jgi:large exoprotein involved in heme utilization and adhesion